MTKEEQADVWSNPGGPAMCSKLTCEFAATTPEDGGEDNQVEDQEMINIYKIEKNTLR